MQKNVGAILDRPKQQRSRHCIVDEQRQTVPVRHMRQFLDIADISCRVPDTFAEDRPGFVVDQLFQSVRMIRLPKPNIYSVAGQQMSEETVRGSVELRNRDNVGAQLGDVEDSIINGGLPTANAQGLESSLKRSDAPFQHCSRRVRNPRVTKSFSLEIE